MKVGPVLADPRKQAGLLLAAYIFLRFIAEGVLAQYSSYAPLLFEVAFIAATFVIYRSQLRFGTLPKLSFLYQPVLSILAGFLVFKFATYLAIPIPFDLQRSETLILLLVVGPLLEELLFRQALWFPFQQLLNHKWMVVIATSLFFSLAHFYAIFLVPPYLHPFLYYQTAYVLLAGLWWGGALLKTQSPWAPIGLHLTFNLGFYLGSF